MSRNVESFSEVWWSGGILVRILWGKPEGDEEYSIKEPIVDNSGDSFTFSGNSENIQKGRRDELTHVYQRHEIIRLNRE